MLHGTAESVSCWMPVAGARRSPLLERDTAAGVCIVGAGIAGLTTAWMLARLGTHVVVLDDKEVGGGETARTTAHLSNAIDDRYVEMERIHGVEQTLLIAASHSAAIDTIEQIVTDQAIACAFRRLDGWLIPGNAEGVRLMEAELAAARRAGLVDVALVPRAPVASFEAGPCLRFPRQAQIHPMRYLEGLARAVERMGGLIYRGAHVVSVEDGPGSVSLWTRRGPVVTAGSAVIATNTPINERVGVHLKQAGYRTYVLGMRVPRGTVPTALYWDTLDPYHYVRVNEDPDETGRHDLLIVGGEDHKSGQADDAPTRFARLEAWGRRRFPTAEDVEYQWSGEIMETIDGLAFIGREDEGSRVYIATGDSGQGMTHGTIAGIVLSDLILGRESSWAELYSPHRKRMGALGEFARENLNVALHYAELMGPGEVGSVGEVAPGTGAVLRRGLRKIAVYRDPRGLVHERSAVCPHLGCVVHWNSMEKSWDCPCHGSRFDALGKVLHGPAVGDLHPAPRPDEDEDD